jgi:hypothetical protein
MWNSDKLAGVASERTRVEQIYAPQQALQARKEQGPRNAAAFNPPRTNFVVPISY